MKRSIFILMLFFSFQAEAALVSIKDIKENFRLGYHGEFYRQNSSGLWNLLTVGYHLGKGYQIEAQGQATIDFTSSVTGVIGNPRFGFSGLLADTSEWTVWTNLNVE